MFRTVRSLIAGVGGAALLAACSASDAVAPKVAASEGVFLSGSSAGGGGGGGGGGTVCTNTLSVTGSATEALTGNAFVANYVLVACQPRTHVSMTATDLSTGAVVWASPDLIGTVALWTLPYRLTSYRIDVRAVAALKVVATASTTVATLNPLPCDVILNQTVTTGYFGIYPAIWTAVDSRDCGRGNTSVHLRITNLTTGQVERDYPTLYTPTGVDFEGSVVAYNAPYRFEVELRTPNGDVLASKSQDVMSAVLR